jgi:hypothetical protein
MDFITVYIPKKIIDRRDWIKYLVIFWKDLADKITLPQNDEFNKFVEKQVTASMQGAKPPEAISGPVMNLVDDLACGREMSMRAGDYIALQTYFKSGKA